MGTGRADGNMECGCALLWARRDVRVSHGTPWKPSASYARKARADLRWPTIALEKRRVCAARPPAQS